jgi:hypothetical protein
MPIAGNHRGARAVALGLFAWGCVPFFGNPEEDPIHLPISISDCGAQGSLRLCIEVARTVDSPAYAHVPGSFELTVSGPIRLKAKDTLAAALRLHFEFHDDGGTQIWEGGDSVALAGKSAFFRACIRDVSDSVMCDSVSVSAP